MNIARRLVALTLPTALGPVALAGPIDPPGGPVAPTGKTLWEVEPRVPITLQYVSSDQDAQFKIITAGSYYATGSVTISSGRAYLEIAASNVTVDLRGVRINGSAGTIDAIFIAPGVSNVRIMNGTITGFSGDGIDLTGVSGCVVENVTVSNCSGTGFRAGPGTLLQNCVANNNGLDGYNLPGGAEATHCSAKSNTGNGFFASGAALMTNCTSRENGGSGFSITSGAAVDRCASVSNQAYGINTVLASDAMRITDCSISQNAQGGMFIANSSLIRGNTVFSSGSINCITLSGSGNRVEGNSTRGGGSSVSCAVGAVDNLIIANWHYSTAGTNGFSATNPASNVVGPIISTTGTISSTNPWANFTR